MGKYDPKFVEEKYGRCGTRIPSSLFLSSDKHWSEVIADEVLKIFPNEEIYTAAAGISPSGDVHFGNFRDVMTAYAVLEELKSRGKKTKFIFSWDNFDRFRKVPAGIDASFEKYIGLPLTSVPDPLGKYPSYARCKEIEFENAMNDLGIELEYRYQTDEYKAGKYSELIEKALQNREEIAEILLDFMTEKGKEEKEIDPDEYKKNFYPITVYSRFTGKDNTKILSYDGKNAITYKCIDTGNEETIDFTKDHIVKLAWKADWPMRWKYEGVVFEPGGKDHASPGGSYDVSSVISQKIFERPAPIFVGYEFIGIQGLGGKMSGSKGNAITPSELLKIYEPELLKWLYLRRLPHQAFTLAFDSEIYRQYEEFDRELSEYRDEKLDLSRAKGLALCFNDRKLLSQKNIPIPFRQAVAFGQIMQWNENKLLELLEAVGLQYDSASISKRIKNAEAWLLIYNPDQMIKIRTELNNTYVTAMTEEAKINIKKFRENIKSEFSSVEELEKIMYEIPKDINITDKENAPRQRAFFKDVYNLLISADTGPRLSTFIWALPREKVLNLLDI